MATPETAPAGSEELLGALTPEQIQTAVLQAEEIQLEAAQTARTAEEFQSSIRTRASALLGAAMGTAEEGADQRQWEAMVTYAVLADRAEELNAATAQTPEDAEEAIERIRGKIERTMENPAGSTAIAA